MVPRNDEAWGLCFPAASHVQHLGPIPFFNLNHRGLSSFPSTASPSTAPSVPSTRPVTPLRDLEDSPEGEHNEPDNDNDNEGNNEEEDDDDDDGEEPDLTFATGYNRSHPENTKRPYPYGEGKDEERDEWTAKQRELAGQAREATDEESLRHLV